MLNPQQNQAVLTTSGKILILAGAGTGKTNVLSHRTAHLIQKEGAHPSSILGLTFTNKAAEEMRSRIAKLLTPQLAKQITLCTFHSFCMQLLRKEIHYLGFTPKFSLYDEKDVKRVLTQIVRHTLAHEGELPSLQSTLDKITDCKNRGTTTLEHDAPPSSWYANFSQDLLERFNTCMRSYNAVDFDSLLTLSVKLFEDFPEILSKYQDIYRYVMIDEYQDTNPIQNRLAELLCNRHQNLCVVGDDDQSIYGWRGAEIRYILGFKADTIIKLEQNYRSTPTILHASNAVIANNQERHPKELWSKKDAGDPIAVFHAPNELEEAQSIADRLVWYRKHKNLEWKDMAILYRSNALSKAFEIALSQTAWDDNGVWRRGIPHQVFGGTEFYERSEIKDLLAYLRLMENPQDEEALLRIINVPRRGISEKCLDLLTQYNRTYQIPLWDLLHNLHTHPISGKISPKALHGISTLLSSIAKAKLSFKTLPLSKALEDFIEEIQYKKAIEDDVKSDTMREFKWENVLSCIEALTQYETTTSSPSLQDFLASTLLHAPNPHKEKKEEKENRVHLMTIHSAKGLEFQACFLTCLEDHIMPHEKSTGTTGIEEERRLMYVAMTRAKNYLTLSMAKERKKMGKKIQTTPSRFLFEIPKHLLKISSHRSLS